MDDPEGVRRAEGVAQRFHDALHGVEREPAALGQLLLEAASGEQLHHQIGLSVGHPADPLDRDHVWVAQQAQRPRLAHEAVDVVGRGQELEVGGP